MLSQLASHLRHRPSEPAQPPCCSAFVVGEPLRTNLAGNVAVVTGPRDTTASPRPTHPRTPPAGYVLLFTSVPTAGPWWGRAGAAGAIGTAVADQLLRNGCTVCICDRGGMNSAMGGPRSTPRPPAETAVETNPRPRSIYRR